MAADWLKIEEGMPDKPEVFQIAAELNIDPDSVAGKLIRVWSWASRSCHADGMVLSQAKSAIDRVAGVPGFAAAMITAGWLIDEGKTIKFPNFDRHNSQTAKDRGLAFLRKRAERERGKGDVTPKTGQQRDATVTHARQDVDVNAEKEFKGAGALKSVPRKGRAVKPYALRGEFPRSDFSKPSKGAEQFNRLLAGRYVGRDDESHVVSLWLAAVDAENPAAWFNAGLDDWVSNRKWRGTESSDAAARQYLKARDSPNGSLPAVQSFATALSEKANA